MAEFAALLATASERPPAREGSAATGLPGDCPDFRAATRSVGPKMGLSPSRDANIGTVPLPAKIRFDPENTRNGLAQLVLALVEMIRELLERQALRRIDAGSLSEPEIDRLGLTFSRLAEEIERLKEYFGFSDEDLNLDLGPLGKLR